MIDPEPAPSAGNEDFPSSPQPLLTPPPLTSPPAAPPVHESLILLILASVQFTNIVDFMVIMPLAPQLERDMGLTPARFSMVVSSYTYAAGLAGLLATMVIDRWPRRSAFLSLYAGFLVGTLACGLAPNYGALLAARFLTGAFGGVLGGMAMTIIGDVFPEHRRGAATGALMSAFAIASIFGVPIGLTLGQKFGWHTPFFVLAALGVPTLLMARRTMPALDAHVGKVQTESALARLRGTLVEPNHLRAFALTVAMQFGSFAVLPFMSPYLVANVRLPESHLALLYIVGGALTLFAAPIAGRIADRLGKLRVYRMLAPVTALVMIAVTNLPPVSTALAVLVMAALMVSNAGRMVPAMAMITSSVQPHRRGGFLGANSAVQHMASGLGTSVAGLILAKGADGRFLHFPVVGAIGAVVTLASMWIAGRLRIADASREVTLEESFAAAAQATVEQAEPIVEI